MKRELFNNKEEYIKKHPYVVCNISNDILFLTRYKTRKSAEASGYGKNGGLVFSKKEYEKWINRNKNRFAYIDGNFI